MDKRVRVILTLIGLLILVGLFYLIAGFITKYTGHSVLMTGMLSSEEASESFVRCINEAGIIMYGSKHCSYCDKQKEVFGDNFKFPEDMGKVCPWLLDSAHGMMRALWMGGRLPWSYKGTPYEKKFDSGGITTEFIRCPDPTSAGIVVKITSQRK